MYENLVSEAFEAMKSAYAPYSNYHVGACVLCKDGRTFRGVNIENASYGATNCAERSAVFARIPTVTARRTSRRLRSSATAPASERRAAICRQVLSELLESDTPIILSNGKETMETTIAELLPMSFGMEDLA